MVKLCFQLIKLVCWKSFFRDLMGFFLLINLYYRSMSGVNLQKTLKAKGRKMSRSHTKDFTTATPEEFVHKFGGNKVINKVLYIIESAVLKQCKIDQDGYNVVFIYCF